MSTPLENLFRAGATDQSAHDFSEKDKKGLLPADGKQSGLSLALNLLLLSFEYVMKMV